MKVAAQTEAFSFATPAPRTEVPAKRPYEVVIVYDQFVAGQHAVETCARLVSDCKDKFNVRVKVWSFAVLRNTAVNLTAASDAAKAQMVMVATSSEDLPPAVKKWMQAWMTWNGGKCGLLVALLNTPDAREDYSAAEAYLRFAAASKGMEFLLEKIGCAGETGEFHPK